MSDLDNPRPKRKILRVKLQSQERHDQPRYTLKEESVYMVWNDGGEMPKRVYRYGEKDIAVSHAKALTEQTGRRFHVLRSYRTFDPLTVDAE